MKQSDSQPGSFQRPRFPRAFALVIAGSLLFLAVTIYAVSTLSAVQPDQSPPFPSVPLTAWLSCLFWFFAAARQIHGREDATTRRLSLIGLAFLVVHNVIVLHGIHRWSMASAYEFIEKMSGFGAGLYVNFAVVLLWALDVVSMRGPSSSATVKWLVRLNRLAIAFIVLNASVFFATTWPKYVAAGLFVWLGVEGVRVWTRRKGI